MNRNFQSIKIFTIAFLNDLSGITPINNAQIVIQAVNTKTDVLVEFRMFLCYMISVKRFTTTNNGVLTISQIKGYVTYRD